MQKSEKPIFILFYFIPILSFCFSQINYNEQCNDFEEYKTDLCESLNSEQDNKKCSLINGDCIAYYKDCQDYIAKPIDKNTCNSIIPPDKMYKCVIDNENKCVSKMKDFDELTDKQKLEICLKLTPEEGKRYIIINNKCELHYNSCEDYKSDVQKNICESNIPARNQGGSISNDEFSKCVYTNGVCVTEKRTCMDLKKSEEKNFCYSLSPKDKNKTCVYSGKKCIENYKTCEDYLGKEKVICESILPFDEGMSYPNSNYKCIIEGEKCVKKEKYCSDWKSDEDEYSCTTLSPKNNSTVCALVKNECIEQFKYCEDYEGNKREICESIEPFDKKQDRIDYSFKCIIEENKCIKKRKTCDDYNPEKDRTYCTLIQLQNDTKKCFYYNKTCIEEYQSCQKYSGKDKNICENIIIYNENKFEIDYSLKCSLKDDECIEEKRSCSEFENKEISDEIFCSKLSTKDPYKKCFFFDNKCIEDYAYCEDYSFYSDEILKDICESIIPLDYKNTKCIFNNGESLSEKKLCNYYNSDLIKNQCENISPDIDKKCEYNKGNCNKKNKYCSEIIDVIDEEICETSQVTAKNKKCIYDKVDEKCDEIDGPDDDSDKENSGIKVETSKFYIILFIIIFVY